MNDEQPQRRLRAARSSLQEGVLTVTVLSGQVEAHRGQAIRADAESEIERAGAGLRAVVLDLSAVIYVNSSGLGELAHLAVSAPAGLRFFAHGLTPLTRESFRLTRLDKLYTIVESAGALKTALAAP